MNYHYKKLYFNLLSEAINFTTIKWTKDLMNCIVNFNLLSEAINFTTQNITLDNYDINEFQSSF